MIWSLRVLVLALLLLMPLSAGAQTPSPLPGSSGEQVLKPQQLDALVAPIALYPDTLLAQVLMASTYPLEVVQAERWATEHKNLEGDPLKKEVEKQGWDDSVKSLVATPSVLTMMSKKLDWTQKLGDTVLAQQPDVMDAIQRLRSKAYATEKLRPSKEQNVTVRQEGNTQIVAIEPTNAGTLYVPFYDPAVVYGEWPYPDYPPYSYYPEEGYLPGGIITTGIAFGAGYALWRWTTGGRFWGGGINWGGGQIDINRGAHVEHWRHNSQHRRGVAYNNPNVRQKFAGNTNRPGNKGQLDLRGRGGQQVLKPGGDRTNLAENRPANRAKASDRARSKQVAQARRPSQASRPSHHRVARNAPSHRVAHRQPHRAPSRAARSHRQSFGFSAPRGGHRMAARGGGFRGGHGGGRRGGGRRSDVALKHDIVLLGRLDNGLGFYRFAYIGSNQDYVGVLAQEVQTVMPEAVVRGRDGYLRVYYDKLGLRFQTYRQWIASGAQVPRVDNLTSSERSRS
jgi:hypothetical protein